MSLEEKGAEYARWITKTGLSDATKKLYPARVHQYLAWVADHYDEHAEALTDPHSRNYAVRDYRHDLMTVDKKAVATVELAMSALGSFYDWLGLGKPKVDRESPTQGAPKSLETTDLRKVMRAAERRGNRDFALTALLFLTGVRVEEAHNLDTDDVLVSDRSGVLHVRYGKGGKARQVPIPSDARGPLRVWIAERRERFGDLGPLFISRTGGRLSVRRMQSLMADIGTDAGVPLSPHVLRHTYARAFLDAGGDLASLQQVLGHKNLSSTQVYTKPRAGRLAELAENVRIEL